MRGVRDINLLGGIAGAFPLLRYCGFGVWLAWSYLAFSGGVWIEPANEVSGSAMSNVFTASTVAFSLACLVCAVTPQRVKRVYSAAKGMTSVGLVCLVGCCMIIVSSPTMLMALSYWGALVCSLVGAALTGFGTALIAGKYLSLFGRLAPKRVWLLCIVNQLLAGALYFVVIGQPPVVQRVLFCLLLPLAAGLSVLGPSKAGERDREPFERADFDPPLFARFCLALFVFNFIESMVRVMQVYVMDPGTSLETTSVAMSIRLLLAIVFLVGVANVRGVRVFSSLYYGCILLVVVIPLVTGMFALGNPVIACTLQGLYTVFEMLAWCVLVHLAHRAKQRSLVIFGRGWGALTFGGLLGWVVGSFAVQHIPNDGMLFWFGIVAAVVCVAVSMFLVNGRDFDRMISLYVERDEAAEPLAERRQAASALRNIKGLDKHGAVTALASEFGLSARETDIFGHIIDGESPAAIAEKCSLSLNTVRRHIQNIYVKAGVHSREELYSAFWDPDASHWG